jgi:hypothetical protein
MKHYLSGMLTIKRRNVRNLKKELFNASGHAQALIMDEVLKEQRQIDHIVYLGNTY